jgi:GT2 family glycosyltransferase
VNHVLILTHNCLEKTKKCIASVQNQDCCALPFVVDNDSTDGTLEWLESEHIPTYRFSPQVGVSGGWNFGLNLMFGLWGAKHVLVINNDTVLAPWTYRLMLDYNAPFVTGVSFGDMEAVMTPREPSPLTPGPDFSCFIIRREAWEKVGPFDERMKHYYSDKDWHVRAHRAGVFLGNSHIKFYHERSSTLKLASPEDQREIQQQADRDRQVFYDKYGCHTWSPQYANLFLPQPVESA